MKTQEGPSLHSGSAVPEARDIALFQEAARRCARLYTKAKLPSRAVRELERRARESFTSVSKHASDVADESARSLLDNMRLIRSSARECLDACPSLAESPALVDDAGNREPRACAIAREFLVPAEGHFSELELIAFIDSYQGVSEIDMGEIWALKPALQFVCLERMAREGPGIWPVLVISLRRIAEASWKDLFESISIVDRVLSRDPALAYKRMDYDSRDRYRRVVGNVAKNSSLSEHEVAEAAIALAKQAAQRTDGSRGAVRRTHVGYFLVDAGLPDLWAAAGFRPPLGQRFRALVVNHPNGFYLLGIELLTFLIVITALSGLGPLIPFAAGFLMLILPATQSAVEFMNNLITSLLRPSALSKLDFSKGIPENSATLVAVPTLLINEPQIRNLALDLEIRFLANRDPNLYFALLTDSPDSEHPGDQQDELVDLCRELIEGLNRRYGSDRRSPFYLLHRHRVFNASEERWMGWERKRGKLLDLNQLVGGGFDSFPVKVGDISVLPLLKYVLTLDSDTQLPPGAAAALVGAISHPLNRAVVDPSTRTVVEGFGILQPRIGISVESASRSRLASIYSGQTGFDIYTRAVSDTYQDLFGEGIFTGKGIYEIETLLLTLQQRFPENALLSHDLIEGAYARVGLVTDIELIDDYPSHFSAYSRRKHRWVRGDWQILRWLFSTVPDHERRLVSNPITLISRWKIFDNLRRSLIEPATLLLFIAGWVYLPGTPRWWTIATLTMLMLPLCSNLLFVVLRMPSEVRALEAWARETLDTLLKSTALVFLGLVFLLHQALLSVDAVVRSVLRVFVTRRRLLEWETAAEAEVAVRRKATVDIYLEWTPWLAVAIGFCVWLIRPAAVPVAAPILALWFISRGLSDWLNRAPRTANRELKSSDVDFLRDSAEKIYRFFHNWSSPATNWLIPDSVQENGLLAPRLSPTNMGFLLNARIAAVHFGFLSLAEFVFQTRQTLDRLGELPKYRGHMLNWYDTDTMAPLEPRFVSTVDSGNLAACLWTLKHAALAFAADPPSKQGPTADLARELAAIADICDRTVHDMDFAFLYHERKKVLSVGYDLTAERLEPSSYDLLASEARIAAFIAIAKGDIPHDAWFHLGRAHTLFRGDRVLVSWTGTMFEYLMPLLWMRHYPGTIMEQSAKAVVRVQREYARRKGAPWGISESACKSDQGSDYAYAAFGIPQLAMKRMKPDVLVISPYSTFLAAAADPQAAIENLRRMNEFGWSGTYGFYEAVDYTRAGGEVIRSWMAHHQGMSLLAACNLLYVNPMQRYFHSEPQVMATELLLQERVPNSIIVEQEKLVPQLAAASAGA